MPSKSVNRAIFIETVPCLKDNLSYLVVYVEPKQAHAIAIDPGEAYPFLSRIKQLEVNLQKKVQLAAVLTTHHHPDHTEGLGGLPAVPTWSSRRDQSRLSAAGGRGRPIALEENRSYSWSDLTDQPLANSHKIEFSIMEIPGHTEGQIAIILDVDDDSHAFVGDTLFSFGCGRCLEGTPEELFASLQRIRALSPNTRLHFGHEYTRRNLEFWIEMQRRLPIDTRDIFDPSTLKAIQKEIFAADFRHRQAPTLAEESTLNPFLKIKNATEFSRWRLERNQF